MKTILGLNLSSIVPHEPYEDQFGSDLSSIGPHEAYEDHFGLGPLEYRSS
ncbi:hypothetical protein [Mesobacillus foraminis]|nr:hypothetical protein [Mesobacillus foraminis]